MFLTNVMIISVTVWHTEQCMIFITDILFMSCHCIALDPHRASLELGSIFHLILYHICVSVIESFVERSDLGNYTTLDLLRAHT